MARETLITFFTGNVGALPALNLGEPAFCVDTGQLFIGNGVSNVPIGGARVPAGNYGSISVSVDGTTWTIEPHVVGADELVEIPQFRVLGRVSTGIGDLEVLTIADLMTFANNFLALGKLAQVSPFVLLGRNTAGTGDVEVITMAQALKFLGFAQGELLYANPSGWFRLSPGVVLSNLQLATIGSGVEPRWTKTGQAYVCDQQTSGTAGGASATGGFNTRALNTKPYDRGAFVSLASNQFTLPAGDYHIRARCPALFVGTHQCRIRNITAGTTAAQGANAYANNATQSASEANVNCLVSLAGSAAFELQHQTQLAVATFGLGAACNNGPEVYAEVWIERLA